MRLRRLARAMIHARERAIAARRMGDDVGYLIAAAEYRRLRMAVAEG